MKIPSNAIIPEPTANFDRLNDFVTDPAGEEGCVLEIYTAVGTFVMVVTLPVENIEPLQPTDRLSVRSCLSA